MVEGAIFCDLRMVYKLHNSEAVTVQLSAIYVYGGGLAPLARVRFLATSTALAHSNFYCPYFFLSSNWQRNGILSDR